MQIHNFYSDLLLSVRILLDNHIFPPKYIKDYEFNIANRTFQLAKYDYKPNYAFPSAIISLNDDQYTFGERPSIIQHLTLENINQIPVLFDYETENKLLLQEEHVQVSISLQINCESQLQAKEVEFAIKRWLPLNKYIQTINFTSFLEVSPNILQTLGMDYNRREIANLFVRLNKNLGEVEYCFSNNYNPLIKLESISSSLSDGTSRSFPVNCELTYQIQMPMWITNERGFKNIERVNIDFNRFGHEPITSNSCRTLINRNFSSSNEIFRVHRNVLMHSFDDWWSVKTNNIDIAIIQKYIDDEKIKIHDIEMLINNESTNPVLLSLLHSLQLKPSDIESYFINKLFYNSAFIRYLMIEEEVITFKDLISFISNAGKFPIDNLILKCMYECNEISINTITTIIYQILNSNYPDVIKLLWSNDLSYEDLINFLIYDSTENNSLLFLINQGYDFTFFRNLYNNEITISDILYYIVHNKLENSFLQNLIETNKISRDSLGSLLENIGLIRNTELYSSIIFSLYFNDFRFEKNYIYNFVDVNGIIHRDVKPLLIDDSIYFSFNKDVIDVYLTPTLTTPIIIQIGENVDTGPDISDGLDIVIKK